jgi:hypothetical protein
MPTLLAGTKRWHVSGRWSQKFVPGLPASEGLPSLPSAGSRTCAVPQQQAPPSPNRVPVSRERKPGHEPSSQREARPASKAEGGGCCKASPSRARGGGAGADCAGPALASRSSACRSGGSPVWPFMCAGCGALASSNSDWRLPVADAMACGSPVSSAPPMLSARGACTPGASPLPNVGLARPGVGAGAACHAAGKQKVPVAAGVAGGHASSDDAAVAAAPIPAASEIRCCPASASGAVR